MVRAWTVRPKILKSTRVPADVPSGAESCASSARPTTVRPTSDSGAPMQPQPRQIAHLAEIAVVVLAVVLVLTVSIGSLG